MVMQPTYILEVPSSELIQDMTILIDVFCGFSHSIQVNAKIVT